MSVRVSQVEANAVQGPQNDRFSVLGLSKDIILGPPSNAMVAQDVEVAVVYISPSTVMVMQDLEVAVVYKPRRNVTPILMMIMA